MVMMLIRESDVTAVAEEEEATMTRRRWLLQLQWLTMLFLIQSISQLTPAVQLNHVDDNNNHQQKSELLARAASGRRKRGYNDDDDDPYDDDDDKASDNDDVGNDEARPRFLESKRNVTVSRGERAILTCRVQNLGSKTVTWRRLGNIHPMTIGRIIFVSDARLSIELDQTQESIEWRLVIDAVRATDEGTYQCQINTKEDQLNHHDIHLHVKFVHVHGTETVERGGSIELTCNATGRPDPPHNVEWFKDGRMIESDAASGVIITKKIEAHLLVSVLVIRRSKMADSGLYHCRASSAPLTPPSSSASASFASASSSASLAWDQRYLDHIDLDDGGTIAVRIVSVTGVIVMQSVAVESEGSAAAAGASRPASVPLLLLADGEEAPPQNCHRLVLLGSAKVGKTAIVNRFLNNKFDDKYTPTIEDFHRKVYRIRRESYRLDILDTSGNNPFPAMKRLSLLTGDLFILVYSIDSRESFEETKRLLDQIKEAKGDPPTYGGPHQSASCSSGSSSGSSFVRSKRRRFTPVVIVGNKCDREANRVVETGELRRLAESVTAGGHAGGSSSGAGGSSSGTGSASGWTVGCVEASAKKNLNIEEIFIKLFVLAKLPIEMSPSLHSKVNPAYIASPTCLSTRRLKAAATGSGGGGGGPCRGLTLRRRLSDACGAVAPNVRRPSIRTDLLLLQTMKGANDSDPEIARRRDSAKCAIQ